MATSTIGWRETPQIVTEIATISKLQPRQVSGDEYVLIYGAGRVRQAIRISIMRAAIGESR
jgi:hypothetical protein